jgi:hypothetical protein
VRRQAENPELTTPRCCNFMAVCRRSRPLPGFRRRRGRRAPTPTIGRRREHGSYSASTAPTGATRPRWSRPRSRNALPVDRRAVGAARPVTGRVGRGQGAGRRHRPCGNGALRRSCSTAACGDPSVSTSGAA